jgi:hypothetical protein
MIEEILVSKTSDGKLFEDKKEAEEHERDIQLRKMLTELVESFYYRGIGDDEIVENLISRISELKRIIR